MCSSSRLGLMPGVLCVFTFVPLVIAPVGPSLPRAARAGSILADLAVSKEACIREPSSRELLLLNRRLSSAAPVRRLWRRADQFTPALQVHAAATRGQS